MIVILDKCVEGSCSKLQPKNLQIIVIWEIWKCKFAHANLETYVLEKELSMSLVEFNKEFVQYAKYSIGKKYEI